MFSMKIKFSLMLFQCFNRPSINIISNLCPLKYIFLHFVFDGQLCRTNYRKIFITLNFDPVVHVIIRSVHSFTLHCIVLEWFRSWHLNPIRREHSLCRSTCTSVPCSIVRRVSRIALDIEVLLWIHAIVMMFAMLYIVLYLLYGYLDWY